MKNLLLFLFAFLTLPSLAQYGSDEVRIIVTPDHADWTYRVGEQAQFTVSVVREQCLVSDARVSYELGPEWYPVEKKSDVATRGGRLVVRGTLRTAGFLRLWVRATVRGHDYDGMATAAYEPERIKACAVCPPDFDAFWQGALAKARADVPLEPAMRLLPDRSAGKVNVYEVSFQNVRSGSRTYGMLCVPKAPGRYPCLLRVPGAGVRPYNGDTDIASRGAITLEIGIHGVPVTMPQQVYDDLFHGSLWNYFYNNMDSREELWYYRVFVGAVRAVDFVATLPEWDGHTLGVTGSSQGGALSIAVAALDKRVSFLAAIHPALCDHRGHLAGRAGGWPHWFRYFPNPTKQRLATADYYDTVNFATRLTQPGWYAWGYNDDVCPPTSTYAAYNAITAPKQLHPYPESRHWWFKEEYEAWQKWLLAQLGIRN